MSWRNTQAAVQSGKLSFAGKQDLGIGQAFADASMIVAKGMIQKSRDAKEEEKLRLKEEKAERKRIAAATSAQETRDKKMKANAIILAERFSGDTSNIKAVDYFYGQLSLYDGDVGKAEATAIQMINDNDLKFTESTSETLPFQGPNVPANAKISDFGAGFNSPSEQSDDDTDSEKRNRLRQIELGFGNSTFNTIDDKPIRLSDLKRFSESKNELNKTQALQMQEMFGDLEGGTTLPEDGEVVTPGDVTLTPYGKSPFKLDVSRIKTLEDIELYQIELKANDVTLDKVMQKVFDDRKEVLEGNKLNDLIKTLAGDLPAAKNQLSAMETLNEEETDEYIAIQSLVKSETSDLKPWENIIEPSSLVGLDEDQLKQRRRIAISLGAPAEKLTTLDAEIVAQRDLKSPIDWSSITADNYTGVMKELIDDDRRESAILVELYGKTLQNPPLTNSDLDAASDDLLAILAAETTDPEYLKRINAMVIQKGTTSKTTWIAEASESVEKAFAAVTRYTQNGEAANLKIAQSLYKAHLSKKLTDPELDASSDDLLDILAAGTTDPDYLKRINAVIDQKGKTSKNTWIAEASQSKDKAFGAVILYTQNKDEANLAIAQSIYQSYLNNEPAKYIGLLEVSSLLGKSYQELLDIESGALSLNAPKPALDFLRKQIGIAQRVEKDAKNLDYIKNSTSFAKTQGQITLATQENASQELINRLIALAASQQKSAALANAGQSGAVSIDAIFKDPVTKKLGYGVLVVGTDGLAKTIDGTLVPEYNGMSEVMTDRFKDIAIQTNKYMNEASIAGVAIAEGLQNAEIVLNLAKTDPRVREFSGDVAQGISNFVRGTGGTLEVLADIFATGATTVTEAQLRAKLGVKPGSEEFVDSIISGNVQNLGDLTAQFEAAMLSLVFRAGRMEGQSGNAMSNKDFERLQEMLNVRGSFEAFEATVRKFMADKIATYDFRATTLMEGAVGSFERDYKFYPVKAPLSFKEFVEKTNNPSLDKTYQNTISYAPNVSADLPEETDNVKLTELANNKPVTVGYGENSYILTKDKVAENLQKIDALFPNDSAARDVARKGFLEDIAGLIGSSYEDLIKLGGY